MVQTVKFKKKPKFSARNVGRKLLNDMARERRAHPAIEDIQKRAAHRSFIMARHEKSLQPLRERYENEEMVNTRANQLFYQYRAADVTWGACVQAVKTDWVPQFHSVWSPRLKAIREEEQARSRGANPLS